mgnify:FL=1
MSRSLLITQKDFVIEKNKIGTKKMIARFIEESGKNYEELCSNKNIIVYNKKADYERAKDVVNQGCKYMDLRSSYFMLLPFFQFLIQMISYFCHHNDTILLDIQLYLLLGLNIILNTILAGMTVSLNMFHKEYKGNEKLGATYNPLTNTIDFYGNKSANRENILQHEFVHSTGNLGNVILNEGYTSILTSKVANTQEKIDYYDKLKWCNEQVINIVGEDIVLKAYSEDNQEFLDKELSKRFKNPENVQELYDLFEQYVNLDLQVSQEKIEYFIAYNLNDEVNAYTCYIKAIKQSNKFEENKELLLIK